MLSSRDVLKMIFSQYLLRKNKKMTLECEDCKGSFDSCGICYLIEAKVCRDCSSIRYNKLTLILCVRKFVPTSPFYKDNLPLDLFKIIYRYIESNVDHKYLPGIKRSDFYHHCEKEDHRWYCSDSTCLTHKHYCIKCGGLSLFKENFPYCSECIEKFGHDEECEACSQYFSCGGILCKNVKANRYLSKERNSYTDQVNIYDDRLFCSKRCIAEYKSGN